MIHDALAAQDSEAEWLSDQRESIDAKTARGIAQLDPGQGICRGGRARTACSSARLSGRTNKRVDGHVNSVAGGGVALYFHTVLDQVQQGFDHLWSDGSRMML